MKPGFKQGYAISIIDSLGNHLKTAHTLSLETGQRRAPIQDNSSYTLAESVRAHFSLNGRSKGRKAINPGAQRQRPRNPVPRIVLRGKSRHWHRRYPSWLRGKVGELIDLCFA
jgi:hypothetical protein